MSVKLEEKITFNKFFKNTSSKPYQISKKDYLENGKYPVVDQGQKFIVGYSNDEEKLFTDTPIIVFGDHTRIIKYIDFDFIIGADGTKILSAFDDSIDTRYAYYQLIYTKIENLGYSRHFKVLREKTFIKSSLSKQKQIAKTLDKAKALIELRKESIEKLDALSRSVFMEMFGDPVENPHNFKIKTLNNFFIDEKNGTKCGPFGSALKKDEYVDSGIPVWNMDNISKKGKFINKINLMITIDKFNKLENYSTLNGDIIISRAGTVGKMCVVNSRYENSIISTNLIRLRLNQDKLLPLYFISLMTYCKKRLKRLETGSDGALTHMSTKVLKSIEFPYPPLDIQNKFAKTIQKIESQKALYEEQLAKLQENFDALLARSFT